MYTEKSEANFKCGSHSVTVPKIKVSSSKIKLFWHMPLRLSHFTGSRDFFVFVFTYSPSHHGVCVCIRTYMHTCLCTYMLSGGQRTAFRV